MNKRKENLIGYAFVAPALIMFLVFIAFPFFTAIGLSFTEWNFLGGWEKLKWVGLRNFSEILVDIDFWAALRNTLFYVVATVPTSIVLALVLAYVLNGNIHCKKALRLAFFIPYISSTVALAAVFKFLFRDEGGIVNMLLVSLGVASPPTWFADPSLSKIPIVMLVVWQALGYELVIYMAALQNVPRDLYEAAEIDGASGVQKFMKVTIPLISPTTFYLLIVRMIAAFKIFSSVNIMTIGTSVRSNNSLVNLIYGKAFNSYKFGYASAESLFLLLLIVIVTAIQFWGQKKWVNY